VGVGVFGGGPGGNTVAVSDGVSVAVLVTSAVGDGSVTSVGVSGDATIVAGGSVARTGGAPGVSAGGSSVSTGVGVSTFVAVGDAVGDEAADGDDFGGCAVPTGVTVAAGDVRCTNRPPGRTEPLSL
jgi:hypothetical protein